MLNFIFNSMEVLLQGTITFGGQDLNYIISQIDKKINISISFLRGSNNNVMANIIFNKLSNNIWQLDKNNTKSDIDVNILQNKTYDSGRVKKYLSLATENYLGIKNLRIVYEKSFLNNELESSKLFIKADDKKIELKNDSLNKRTDKSCVDIKSDIYSDNIDINLDMFIEKFSGFKKKSIENIVKELCEDFEKTINNQIEHDLIFNKNLENIDSENVEKIIDFTNEDKDIKIEDVDYNIEDGITDAEIKNIVDSIEKTECTSGDTIGKYTKKEKEKRNIEYCSEQKHMC